MVMANKQWLTAGKAHDYDYQKKKNINCSSVRDTDSDLRHKSGCHYTLIHHPDTNMFPPCYIKDTLLPTQALNNNTGIVQFGPNS